MKQVFLHGLESSSKGTKATFLRGFCPDILIPDFRGGLAERMAALTGILSGQKDLILVGSSFGGLMATIYAMEHEADVIRLVLLAPALNFPEFSNYRIKRIAVPVWMVIGADDSVTPVSRVMPLARKIFINLDYNEVADDHMLAASFRKFDWKSLLAAQY
jgi:pimeloyl-ACP methyl ester carboxylesterase